MSEINATLSRYWGYDDFRPGQRDIIDSTLQGKDTLAVMPTGGGKSLCYQVPAMTGPKGLTLVVSPLIALMKDQVQDLKRRQIAAEALTSELTLEQQSSIIAAAQRHELRLLYLSPERLNSERFRDALMGFNIVRLVVDEAHCISQWSQDFRPAYRNISQYLEQYEHHYGIRLPRLALTATANIRARQDILVSLGMGDDTNVFVNGFERPNLTFSVMIPNDRANEIVRLIHLHRDEKTLVYVSSRERCMTLATRLKNTGIEAAPFHAGLPQAQKDEVLEDFRTGEISAVVATNAFGMGIDIPDIRLVLHHDMPSSMEAYYQEAGRAGRDLQPAKCMLLAAPDSDKRSHNYRIDRQYPPREDIEAVMNTMGGFYGHEAVFDLEPVIVETLAPNVKPVRIQGALQFLEREGWLEKVINLDSARPFDSRQYVIHDDKVLEWERLEIGREDAIRNLSVMVGFVNTKKCRQRYICQFFEGTNSGGERCGRCDLCQQKGTTYDNYRDYALPLLKLLKQEQGGRAPNLTQLSGYLCGHQPVEHSSYGAYRQCTVDQVNRYIRNLYREALIGFSDDVRQCVFMTTAGHQVLVEGRTVATRPPSALLGSDSAQAAEIVHPETKHYLTDEQQTELKSLLTDVRSRLAKKSGVAALMVFSRQTLESLVEHCPSKIEDLKAWPGFKGDRLAKYGPNVIECINRFRQSIDPEKSIDDFDRGAKKSMHTIDIGEELGLKL